MPSLDDLLDRYPDALISAFGDSPELSARLIALIRAGKKTATCGALMGYLEDEEEIPEAGDISIVLDWDEVPQLVIRHTEVTIRAFCDVPEDFALAEGENDTYEGWAADHRAYFERNGGFHERMELVCERFVLVADLSSASAP